MAEPAVMELEICGTCGALMPQTLWSGARIVSGPPCTHRDRQPVAYERIRLCADCGFRLPPEGDCKASDDGRDLCASCVMGEIRG